MYSSSEVPVTGLRVLVVDDDPGVAQAVGKVVRLLGHSAETVTSGREALSKAAETCFDCILSDVRMPGMNGVELYRAAKSRWPDMSFIMMTAYTVEEAMREGLDRGEVTVLIKPLDIDDLSRRLEALPRRV